jgi:hypothetical protein
MGRDLVIPEYEIRQAYTAATGEPNWTLPPRHDEGLAAVAALVQRNLRPASGPDRCSACGRTARHLIPATELVDGRLTVVARLGPTCYREHLRAGDGRQTLPIGGEPEQVHEPLGDGVQWNPANDEYDAECSCGETFSAWASEAAEERLLIHLGRQT